MGDASPVTGPRLTYVIVDDDLWDPAPLEIRDRGLVAALLRHTLTKVTEVGR